MYERGKSSIRTSPRSATGIAICCTHGCRTLASFKLLSRALKCSGAREYPELSFRSSFAGDYRT